MAPRIWNAKFLPARRSSIGKTEWIFIGCSTCAMQSRCLLSRKSVTVLDRKSTRLNSSHDQISYAVFCLKKKKNENTNSERKRITVTLLTEREKLHQPEMGLSGPQHSTLPDRQISDTDGPDDASSSEVAD